MKIVSQIQNRPRQINIVHNIIAIKRIGLKSGSDKNGVFAWKYDALKTFYQIDVLEEPQIFMYKLKVLCHETVTM